MQSFKEFIMYYGILVIRFLLNILNLFPIKKNRILFYSFNGKNCSCNPYYISKYLSASNSNQYDMIWAFKNPENWKAVVPDGCRTVKFRSLKYYYYAKTAKVIVYNVQEEGELSRRKNQIFIQTWHASNGYKKISHPKNELNRKKLSLMHKNYSYTLSGCESMTERRIRKSMGFQGEVLPGTPRMDILINQNHPEYHTQLLSELQLPENAKLLLYAPTWKKNRKDTDYGLDYANLKQLLEKKFGGDWYLLIRFHPNMTVTQDFSQYSYIRNVTKYGDMQKLLYSSDAMISDYSSCVWDFSFTYRPCFLFCNDFEESGGNSMFEIPIQEWGFPFCQSMEELTEAIQNFDSESYQNSIEQHHQQMGSLEDGKATERVCRLIEQHLK